MKAQHGHRWTNEELVQLMQSWQAGSSLDEISIALKTSTFAITKMITKLRKNGIPLKHRTRGAGAHLSKHLQPWTQADIEYLLRQRKEKITAEEIASSLGRTVLAVNGMIGTLRREYHIEVPMLGQGVRKLWNPDILKAQLSTLIVGEGE